MPLPRSGSGTRPVESRGGCSLAHAAASAFCLAIMLLANAMSSALICSPRLCRCWISWKRLRSSGVCAKSVDAIAAATRRNREILIPFTLCFCIGLFHELFDPHHVDGPLPVAVALEVDALAVGREDRRHGARVARLVLAHGQLAARHAQQQQD